MRKCIWIPLVDLVLCRGILLPKGHVQAYAKPCDVFKQLNFATGNQKEIFIC